MIKKRPIDKLDTYKEVVEWIESNKVPFKPVGINWKSGMWRFDCCNLGSNGQCTDYENRPQLCRSLQPQSESLCCVPKPGLGEWLGDLVSTLWEKIGTEVGTIRKREA